MLTEEMFWKKDLNQMCIVHTVFYLSDILESMVSDMLKFYVYVS